MRSSSRKIRVAFCLLPVWLSLAAASCGRGIPVQSYPPNADLQAVTEPQPRPSPAIVTDPQANSRYQAATDRWGNRVYDSGVRICQWVIDMGGKLPFDCKRPRTVTVP